MSDNKKKQLNREKSIKSKLANSRKIIQNKFKRAYKDRIDREIGCKEKYQPITNAISKLAENSKKRIPPNNFYNGFDYDDYIGNSEHQSVHTDDTQSMHPDDRNVSSDSEDSRMDFSEGHERETSHISKAGP